MRTMASDERILAALRRQDVDYAPCVPLFWQGTPRREAFRWNGEEERIRFAKELGVDAVLSFALPWPPMEVRSWVGRSPDERYPLLHNEVATPRGPLAATLRRTEDYPHGDRIPFFSDWTVSRYVKPWVETEEDVERLAFVYRAAEGQVVEESRDRLESLRRLADTHRVPIVCGGFFALNAAIHLMGAQQAATASMDRPEVIQRLMEVVHRVQRRNLEVLLSWGANVVLRNGWYDTTDFWSPAQFRRWVVPGLREDIEAVHATGGTLIYQCCTGIGPLLPALGELELDCLLDPEPVLGKLDLRQVAAALPGKSFWGGLSAPMHIGRGTPEAVRQAVREAFAAFGRRGFLLKAVPSIRAHWPWENVLAMIDEWRSLR